jgi:hypothetical protein
MWKYARYAEHDRDGRASSTVADTLDSLVRSYGALRSRPVPPAHTFPHSR